MQALRRYFSFPASLSPELRGNIIAYFWDIGWWGLYVGSTVSFLTIYATRYGATPEQIGLLTAMPAVVSLSLSIPLGWVLQRRSAGQVTVGAAFFSRIFFIVYAILPWILPAQWQVEALLVLAVVIAVPTTVINISFSQLFLEAIPSERRGAVVGTRNAIMSFVSFPVTLLCGQLLTWLEFPSGYQVVFLFGFIGGIMTVRALSRVKSLPSPQEHSTSPFLAQKRRWLPDIDVYGRRYIRVIGLLFLFNLTNNMMVPLVPDLLVRKLQFSEGLIGLGTATANFLFFIVSLAVIRVTRRTGNRIATAYGALLLAFNSVFLAFARDVALYMAAVVVGGIASGILGAAQYNYHLDHLPQSDRSAWLSWNLMLGNAAILLGSLGGPALALQSGTPLTLMVISGLRILIGLTILLFG